MQVPLHAVHFHNRTDGEGFDPPFVAAVQAFEVPDWLGDLLGAAAGGEPRKLRTSRIGQSQKFGALVERLARRIVARLAQDRIAADAPHLDEHGMAA